MSPRRSWQARDLPGIDGQSFNLIADAGLTARDYVAALESCTDVEFQKIPTPIWKFYLADLAKWLVKCGRSPSRPPAAQLSRLGVADATAGVLTARRRGKSWAGAPLMRRRDDPQRD